MPRSTCVTKKRNKAAKARNRYVKRMKILHAIENSEDYVAEDAHLKFFENVLDTTLPSLYIENDVSDNPPKNPLLTGNRIVDITYFIDEARKLTLHDTSCTMGKMTFCNETRNGLVSHLTYKCYVCNNKITLKTQNSDNDINQSLVWGASAIGTGYFQIEELLSVMNIPTMTKKTYKKVENVIHSKWERLLWQQMHENAITEKKMAIEAGHVEHGIPYITVIVDGSWAKRSYGHSYSSLSGAACIIGHKTKKLLYLGVKNKFCYVCATNNTEHKCYKNFSGASTAMEQSIIVEGFNKSERDYGLRYKFLIGDGDSSVYTRILENVTYGRYVTKLECANHITRAFTSNLHKLAKNSAFDVKARNIIKSKINSLSGLIRTVIARTPDVNTLKVDIKNSPRHIFGDHCFCRKEVCSKGALAAENHVPLLESANIFNELTKLCDNIVRKADRLSQNVTTNYAERYMSVISKFTGGKRVNLIRRGVYQHRCIGAGLAYNMGYAFHKQSTKLNKHFLEKFCVNREKRKIYKKKVKKNVINGQPDMDYGVDAAQPDMDLAQFNDAKNRIMANLNNIDHMELEKDTVGQRDNIKWFQARRNRITASNFGKICLRRKATPCNNLIKEMLYKNMDLKTKAIQYGIENEKLAITRFKNLLNITVSDCGFFICKNYSFLGASPDGVTGNGEIVEVKCLYSIKDQYIKEAIKNNKKLCVKLDTDGELILKGNHHYFFQIQGQLNICDKDICYLILFTDIDLQFLKVIRDKEFWQKRMLPRLITFWEHCVLPELADPRIPRGLKARDITVLQKKSGENESIVITNSVRLL